MEDILNRRYVNWVGPLEERFRWLHFRSEMGRVCRIRDGLGNIIQEWWEWTE
jgi:hypothetical protein